MHVCISGGLGPLTQSQTFLYNPDECIAGCLILGWSAYGSARQHTPQGHLLASRLRNACAKASMRPAKCTTKCPSERHIRQTTEA